MALLVLAAVALAFVQTACDGSGSPEEVEDDATGSALPVIDTSEPGGFIVPTPTEEENARAEGILASDARAQMLLGGKNYTIEEVSPVIDSDSGSSRVVGVSMRISLAEASSVEGVWLMKHDPGPEDPQGSRPEEVLVHFPDCAAPNGVREVIATVDLARGKLILLEPLGVPGFDVGLRYCPEGQR